ncbi:MAG: efflux RND transporter periplasmic adaptor subunit [Paracoccaceae bacterium]
MRLFPIVTALLVTVAIYFLLFEREKLVAFARSEPANTTTALPPAAEPVETRPPVSVLAVKSAAQEIDSGVVIRGRTEAARKIDVRAEISGLVISEPLRKGAFVNTGQVLCELDPGTRAAALTEAKARLAEATINENAARSLARKGFGSQTAATSRRAALEAAEAGVERAKKEIERLKIAAPFDGLLETDTAELGTLLQPGARCAEIIQLDPIQLVGFVPEQDIGRIQQGAPAAARLADGTELRGTVSFLSRSSDPTTRTFRVDVTVPNPDLSVRDGATAEIFIAIAGHKAHLLPQSALTLDNGGRLGVRVAQDGVARFLPVSIVRDDSRGVWLAGLPDRVDVIVVGQEYVIDGRQVSVTYREQAK